MGKREAVDGTKSLGAFMTEIELFIFGYLLRATGNFIPRWEGEGCIEWGMVRQNEVAGCLHPTVPAHPPDRGVMGSWAELCPLSMYMLESYLPGPQNGTVFGDKGFTEVIKVK